MLLNLYLRVTTALLLRETNGHDQRCLSPWRLSLDKHVCVCVSNIRCVNLDIVENKLFSLNSLLNPALEFRVCPLFVLLGTESDGKCDTQTSEKNDQERLSFRKEKERNMCKALMLIRSLSCPFPQCSCGRTYILNASRLLSRRPRKSKKCLTVRQRVDFRVVGSSQDVLKKVIIELVLGCFVKRWHHRTRCPVFWHGREKELVADLVIVKLTCKCDTVSAVLWNPVDEDWQFSASGYPGAQRSWMCKSPPAFWAHFMQLRIQVAWIAGRLYANWILILIVR